MPMPDAVRAATLHATLVLKTGPRAVTSVLGKRPATRAPLPTRERIQVAALQMSLDLVDEVAPWVAQCERLTRLAVERGAQLVVFPEYVSLPLFGLVPRLRDLLGFGVPLGEIIAQAEARAFLPLSQRVFETLGAELAARYGIYVMMGTTITTDSTGSLFNTAFLFDPDGRRAGIWDKLLASAHETEWMTRGDDVRVVTLPFAQISVLLGAETQTWEAARIATLRGAEILLCASGEPPTHEPAANGRGIASRVQENRVFGVQARALTSLCGLNWGGPSTIVAPMGLAQVTNVFLACARIPNVEEVIVAELDLAALRLLRESQPLDWNIELYRKHFTRAYEP